MIPMLAILAALALHQGGTLDDIVRAQALVSTGDVLEGSLLLRQVAEGAEAEPAARDLARYYLGVLRLDADDVEGAGAWFEQIEREPADARLRLSLAFRRGEVEARRGHPERVVPTVLPRLEAAERAWAGELPAAEIAFQALQLAYGFGHPEWVPALTGRSVEAAVDEVVTRGAPQHVAALAVLPGVPPDVLARVRAARGPSAAVAASLGAGAPVPGEESLLGDLPTLARPAGGAVLVAAPLTGPHAAFGEALRRVLSFAALQRAQAEPWRWLDTGADGWSSAATEALAAGDAALVLGPLGARSLAELTPLVKAHPLPLVPLFPDVADREVAFPLLPLAFDLDDELRVLFAAAPLEAGARVAVLGSEAVLGRGLLEALQRRLHEAGGEVSHTWTLPAEPRAQVSAVDGWLAGASEGGDPGFDALFLATGPAEGLRALTLLHFQGVPLESAPPPTAPRARNGAEPKPVRLYALHTVLGSGFLDPVTHLSRGTRVADPCPASPERLAALEALLGRPAFPVERYAAHLADVVLQARELAREGTALDLARVLASNRRWAGLCGTLEVREGKGHWDFRLTEVDARPVDAATPTPAPDRGAPR